jgi:hypothetical protein
VLDLAFSADGGRLAAAGQAGGAASFRVWDATPGGEPPR